MKIIQTFLAVPAAGATILFPVAVWAQQPPDSLPYGYGCGQGMMGWGGGWYGMILGPFFMVLVLAAAIAAVVLLVRSLGGPWHGMPPFHHGQSRYTHLDILKERYARGEIDKAEFEERSRVIGG